MENAYVLIIVFFVLYYLIVLLFEKRMIYEPRNIIEKFLAVLLLYAGISLVYFSLTGKPFISDSIDNYYIYIFIIGFIAVIWAVPTLLSEFRFFKKFMKKNKGK